MIAHTWVSFRTVIDSKDEITHMLLCNTIEKRSHIVNYLENHIMTFCWTRIRGYLFDIEIEFGIFIMLYDFITR